MTVPFVDWTDHATGGNCALATVEHDAPEMFSSEVQEVAGSGSFIS